MNGWKKFVNWISGGNAAKSVVGDDATFKPVSEKSSPITSLFNKFFGTGITGAEEEQNKYTAQREDTQAQRAVQDYKAAGLNPALMFGNGAGGDYASASAGGVAGSGNLGDMVQALTLPLQLQQMRENIELTKANALRAREDSQTERMRRQNLYQQTQKLFHEMQEIHSRTVLNEQESGLKMTASNFLARQLDAALRETESRIELNAATQNRIDALLPGEQQLQHYQLDDFIKKWQKIDAEIKAISTQTKISVRDLEDYALNRLNTGIVADIFRAWIESKNDSDGDGKRDEQ